MKKVGFMIVYNDADYVDYAIRSVKDWLDELIIVEGAFQITMKTGKPPRSDDGTLDIIAKHVDNKKVFLKQVNLREHKDHYDVGYQWAIERGADWAIMIDSDEVWTKPAQVVAETLMTLEAINFDKPVKEMRVFEHCFINDFKTWYPGTYPRIFKCEPGARFVFDNEVQFSEGRGQHRVQHTNPNFKVFHYGYVRRAKRWQMKQDYMWEKDQNPNLKTYKLEGNSYVIPADIPIYKFVGQHPDIMKAHPFFGKTAEEIIYG